MTIEEELNEIRKHNETFASEIVPFKGPHYGVHVRMWRSNEEGIADTAAISVECHPEYAGIGVGLTHSEAKGLGEALIRAAHVAFNVNAQRPEDMVACLSCKQLHKVSLYKYWTYICPECREKGISKCKKCLITFHNNNQDEICPDCCSSSPEPAQSDG